MILETHVEKAIEELGAGCNVTLQGRFDETSIRIEVEIASQDGEIPWFEPYLEAACLLFVVNTIMIESPSTVNFISISRLKKGAATE
jgi:hypothetical protein